MILLVCITGFALIPIIFYTSDVLSGVNHPYTAQIDPHPAYPELGIEWEMHPVDNPGDWLPNGLDVTDVNGDGYLDIVTNYEYKGRIRVAFHPGPTPNDDFWVAIDAGIIPNAESAAFGDLDGDGHADIVVAHGIEHTDMPPGIRILWGNRPTESSSGERSESRMINQDFSWSEGEDIPSSMRGWQILYVKTIDLDLDGDLDIIAGGRASRMAGLDKEAIGSEELITWAGIRWFENPGENGGGSRLLQNWNSHGIDPSTKSGHGFESGDIDGDGDLDIANNNADWDTPDDEESITWYENPGARPDLYLAWTQHEIYHKPVFYGKEQVVIADLDNDGRNDLISQTDKAILWFKQTMGDRDSSTPAFELLMIDKHPAIQWRARALEVADMNNDGKKDIIGALIHRDGVLPKDKAAVFWMEQGKEGWITHVIKWGDNFWGLGQFNGEKWDQFIPYDIDDDGDLDLIANCEEYNRLKSIISVVWFENPLNPK